MATQLRPNLVWTLSTSYMNKAPSDSKSRNYLWLDMKSIHTWYSHAYNKSGSIVWQTGNTQWNPRLVWAHSSILTKHKVTVTQVSVNNFNNVFVSVETHDNCTLNNVLQLCIITFYKIHAYMSIIHVNTVQDPGIFSTLLADTQKSFLQYIPRIFTSTEHSDVNFDLSIRQQFRILKEVPLPG